MRRILAAAGVGAAAVLTLAGCSNGTIEQSGPGASGSATPPSPSATSDINHLREVLECGMFDTGAVYLNEEWPAIIGGHPRYGYALNLEQAADTWQKGLNSYSSSASLDAAIGRAESGIHDMETAMAQSNGSAPVEIGPEVRQIQDAFTAASSFCAETGYNMTQPLATAS